MPLVRLQKFLAEAGVASRRKCEELIKAGLVKVNGRVITRLGTRVDPAADRVEVAGRPVERAAEKVYILLHKPAGYVTTARDPQGRPTVLDLVRDVPQRIFPVGRLDCDTEGLLLLTNDGELAHALTHPRHEVKKTYLAWVRGFPEASRLARMEKGLPLSDGPTAPADVRLKGKNKKGALLEITIHEGRKRQVKRMCALIGHPVERLKRIRLGSLSLGGLKPGQYRFLTGREAEELKKLALQNGGRGKFCRNSSPRGEKRK